jgi:hypothetical protein
MATVEPRGYCLHVAEIASVGERVREGDAALARGA